MIITYHLWQGLQETLLKSIVISIEK